MSLNARAIALQGLGFALHPIALAVQGLIDWLMEEAKSNQVYGRGRGRGWGWGRGQHTQSRPTTPKAKRPEGPSYEDVQKSWELLEMRAKANEARKAKQGEATPQPKKAAKSVEMAPVIVRYAMDMPVIEQPVIAAAVAQAKEESRRLARMKADEQEFFVMLMFNL